MSLQGVVYMLLQCAGASLHYRLTSQPLVSTRKPHEIFPKMPRPLSLETGVLVDYSTENG